MINQYGFEIGVMAGRHPFVRIGKQRAPIVVLPGLELDHRPPSWWVMSSSALGYHRLAAIRTVFVVLRRRGLRPDTTLQDLANEFAALIRDEWGQADVLGHSCGGVIAQHIGLNHPEAVGSLILAQSGARLGTAGRDLGLRWLGLAQTGEWSLLREELLRSGLDGDPSLRVARAYRVPAEEGRAPDPVDTRDFVTILSSLLTEDTSSRLPGLSMRTLVIGSGQDQLYPESALRDLAGAIPQSTLVIHPEVRSRSTEHARDLQDDVLDFLLDRTPAREQASTAEHALIAPETHLVRKVQR